jgi:hypothetical protein
MFFKAKGFLTHEIIRKFFSSFVLNFWNVVTKDHYRKYQKKIFFGNPTASGFKGVGAIDLLYLFIFYFIFIRI